MSDIVFNGVSLMALTFGLVEIIKSWFSIGGKVVTGISMGIGILLNVGYNLSVEGLPTEASGWFSMIIGGLAFGLAASGFYKFVDARTPDNSAG